MAGRKPEGNDTYSGKGEYQTQKPHTPTGAIQVGACRALPECSRGTMTEGGRSAVRELGRRTRERRGGVWDSVADAGLDGAVMCVSQSAPGIRRQTRRLSKHTGRVRKAAALSNVNRFRQPVCREQGDCCGGKDHFPEANRFFVDDPTGCLWTSGKGSWRGGTFPSGRMDRLCVWKFLAG